MSASSRLISSFLLAAVIVIPRAQAEKITIPAGTRIEARMDRELRSDTAVVGEAFEATVTEHIRPDGVLAIPADSTLEGRVTIVRPGAPSGVLGVRFVRLRTLDGHVYDIDGVLAPTKDGQTVPIESAKKSAVILIGSEAEPGKHASTVVGDVDELPAEVADRWSQSGLSAERAVVPSGSVVMVELRQKVSVEETTR